MGKSRFGIGRIAHRIDMVLDRFLDCFEEINGIMMRKRGVRGPDEIFERIICRYMKKVMALTEC